MNTVEEWIHQAVLIAAIEFLRRSTLIVLLVIHTLFKYLVSLQLRNPLMDH